MNPAYPLVVRAVVQNPHPDERYLSRKRYEVRKVLKVFGDAFRPTPDNTFVLTFDPRTVLSHELHDLDVMKFMAELQAEFSRYILLPYSSVRVREVWKVVDFDPFEYIWVRDAVYPLCEHCYHTNVRKGCPDFFKYTALDVIDAISRHLNGIAGIYAILGSVGGKGESTQPARDLFLKAIGSVNGELSELGRRLGELLPKYVVPVDYDGGGDGGGW